MLIVMIFLISCYLFTLFLAATDVAISPRLSDVLSHAVLSPYCPPSPSRHHVQVTTRSSGRANFCASFALSFLYMKYVMFVRDELNANYEQYCNSTSRPLSSALHSVLFMRELQRYIMSFLGS